MVSVCLRLESWVLFVSTHNGSSLAEGCHNVDALQLPTRELADESCGVEVLREVDLVLAEYTTFSRHLKYVVSTNAGMIRA